LRRAIARVSTSPLVDAVPSPDYQDDLPQGFAAQVFADALETTTSQLLHEIEPILGTLRLAAETEIPNYEHSNTRKSIERLDEFLAALSRLRRAASAPKIKEFVLDELITRCIQELKSPEGLQIRKAGAQQCVVEGDSSLIGLCISNGLRNAIEATVATRGELPELPVTVAWGTTDCDCWLSIVDLGIGFKGNLRQAFEMGTTSKEGHLGMGLAIAEQAITSMGGHVNIIPNEQGTRFEIRWPKITS